MRKLIALVVATLVSSAAVAAVTADLKLEVQGDTVLASVVVKQDGNSWKDGKVTVKWTAPADKYCNDSAYDLSYKASDRYRTRASRTWRVPIAKTDCTAVCDGTWAVSVVAEDGSVLASGTITFDKDGKVVEPKKEEPKADSKDKKKKK